MYYQIRLPLVCLFILVYCYLYYQRKKRLPTRTCRVFGLLSAMAVVHLAAAVVTEYTVNNREAVPEAFNYGWHIVFLVSVTWVCTLLLYYLLLYIERGAGRQLRLEKAVALGVCVLGTAAQIILPIEYIDTPYGSYSLGPKAYSLYAVVAYVLVELLWRTIRYRQVIGRERSNALLASVAIFTMAALIQIHWPYMLLTGPAVTMLILGIMVNTEDAHLYVSYRTGLYNELACREILLERLLEGKPFQAGVYVFLGNDLALERAMASLERKLSGKRRKRLICAALTDNTMLVLPLAAWGGALPNLPKTLPPPDMEGLEFKYLARKLDCVPGESMEQVLDAVRDIRVQYEEDVLHRDELTGVLRREAFIRRVDYLVRKQRPFSLVMVDLDNFKAINDTYGHGVGDAVLKFTTDTFRSALRDTDIICRMGGDEFAVALTGVTERERVLEIIGRIMDQLAASEIMPGRGHRIYLSVGVKVYLPEDGAPSFQELYAEADAALYRTKYRGKNGVSFAGEADLGA